MAERTGRSSTTDVLWGLRPVAFPLCTPDGPTVLCYPHNCQHAIHLVQLKNTQIQQERIAYIVDGELGAWEEERRKQRFLDLYSSSSMHYPRGAQQCPGHKEPQADMG